MASYRTTAHISTCAYKRKVAVFVVIPVPILFVYKHSANSRGTLRTRTTRIYDSRSTIYDSSFTTRRQSWNWCAFAFRTRRTLEWWCLDSWDDARGFWFLSLRVLCFCGGLLVEICLLWRIRNCGKCLEDEAILRSLNWRSLSGIMS